ncbi:MAG: undecaprenyldiphospho-muramoylpentapeptide beta-N-acetylglucosaminyltransferase [Gammaproteobacteria bacterium]
MAEFDHTVLIVAGGTGGHIYPALAVAACLNERKVATVWLGSRYGMETRIVPQAGLRLLTIAVSGVRGRGVARWLAAPFVIGFALMQALAAMIKVRPQVVLGMGGFASGPGGLAAWLCRRPLVVHEQNAIPGLTNKLLSRLATTVFQAFPDSFPATCGAITIGNPVRADIVALAPPAERDVAAGPLRILVIGGSRGARALNESVPAAVRALHAADLSVWHQCGEGNAAQTEAAYRDVDADVRVSEFVDDMAAAYAWASVVVCRSGALTVSELAAAGVASILVPFPYAVDDHQSANARFLVDADAALLVAEGADFEQRLAAALASVETDRERVAELARHARALAIPDAAANVAARCMELLHG